MEAGRYLVGKYTVTVDPQNRLIVPTPWQQSIGEFVTVIRDESASGERFLTAMPDEAFASMMSDFEHIPASSRVVSDVTRDILQNACQCRFDSKRRITVSADSLEYAGVSGSALLTSNVRSNKPVFEIWDPEAHKRNEAASNAREQRDILERNANEVRLLAKKD